MDKLKDKEIAFEHLDCSKLPKHVAVIMDGNGRWAQLRSKPRLWGHRHGLDAVRRTVAVAKELSIEVLSLYAFSDENWQRSKLEIAGIFQLLDHYITEELKVLQQHKIRLRIIGNLNKLPAKIRERLLNAQAVLSEGDGLILNIALSYGARNEIVEACRSIAKKVSQNSMNPSDISVDTITEHLWTKGLSDPDLLIRTSGEQRLSNLLLWQMAYTELCFSSVYWPDFEKKDFIEALLIYQKRKRRFGRAVEANSN